MSHYDYLIVGSGFFRATFAYRPKQIGKKCFVIDKRLPVRMFFDNNYFNDKYQGIPVSSYNKLIDGFLESVDTLAGVDFFGSSGSPTGKPIKHSWKEIADKLAYTVQLMNTLTISWVNLIGGQYLSRLALRKLLTTRAMLL